VVGRDITAYGSISGTILASEVVDVRASADVTGRVVAPRIILAEGARFNGSVEPHQFESALRVARYRREK
jgi:cytoskeletal protein CcmA (bactofilin family)